ncbi:MAG: CRTAC1 family protein [Candidatus Neomarinimicrobiota bacterium]
MRSRTASIKRLSFGLGGVILLGTAMLFSIKVTRALEETEIRFVDQREYAGIDFEHYAERPRWCEIGPTVRGAATNEGLDLVFHEEKEFWKSRGRLLSLEEFAHVHLIKTNGSGGAWLDYDRDGDWDLYLVNCQGPGDVTNALYENMGDGTFSRKSSDCGVLDPGEGMGVSVADYDNDGYPDLFVTNYGNFILYRNNGDNSFADVTDQAFPEGVKDRWYGGSSWGDYDRDGDLDVYVMGYVDFSNRPLNTSLRFPMDFGGLPNTLYRSNGDGTFTDVTDKAGVGDAARKSMQAVFNDFNDDGWPDIFVTNDTDANGLYLNKGDGTFKSFSGPSGLSTTDGSMGIAVGDFNADGKYDLTYTNYAAEVNVLAQLEDNETSNDGVLKNAIFVHEFDSPLVHKLSWPAVSWGTGLFDLDNDGDLDLFFANGHLNAVSGDNRQLNLLFENDGHGRFNDVSESSGVWNTGKRIHRSAIFADYDNDGRVDIYITNNGQQIEDGKGNTIDDPDRGVGVLYHNESRTRNNWLKVRLEGVKSNRDAYGSRVEVTTGDLVQVQPLISGTGYLSANAKELYFGLGSKREVDRIEIIWPNGHIQAFENIEPNQTLYIVEGEDLHDESLALTGR